MTAAPVANLLDEAARTRAEEPATRETARALVRKRRLDELAGAEEATWAHVEQMIGTRKPDVYDDAVGLLTDLQALTERDDRPS
jgi:hypothetical protein